MTKLKENIQIMNEITHHLVVDGFYYKNKFINSSNDLRLYMITKLRVDANLKYITEISYQEGRRGSPRKYDRKFDTSDLSRFEKINHQGLVLYSKEMYSPQFQRNLKIVVVQNQDRDHHILCSTDMNLSEQDIFDMK